MLAAWDAGAGARRRHPCPDIAQLSTRGGRDRRTRRLADYARGGSAAEAVWIAAQQHGLAVQPISPAFLYARDDDELNGALAAVRHASCADLQRASSAT